MVDGTIITWLRADGDEVAIGEEIVEIETDKAIVPYEAEYAGTLKIVAQDGAVISVGAVIGYIGEEQGFDAAAAPAGAAATSAVASASSVAQAVAARVGGTEVAAPPASKRELDPIHPGETNGRVKASPVAKRLATSAGVDLTMLTGSGPGGRIVKRDVEGATSAPAGGQRQPLTSTQATIARRMVEAKSAPEFTVTVDIDMEMAVDLRAQLKQAGVDPLPSLGDFVVKACATALRAHPRINSSYADDAIELHARVNIGVAVAAGAGVVGGTQSLLVPTLYDADTKSLGQIAQETRTLAERGREARLTPAEMSNATFTVSNLGMYGVSQFTAVLNPPQAAILAVGAAEQRAVVRDGALVARQRMTVTLTSDHRVIYGADAAAFLASVRENLENPLTLVL
jgi:pyruvate dehydrogenase E2 component (dihydrolipoamide acetyltransferase)